MWRKSPPVA
jgi:hypothetical protein